MTGFSLVTLCDRLEQLERFLVFIISLSDCLEFTILYSEEQLPDTSTWGVKEKEKEKRSLVFIVCFKTNKPPLINRDRRSLSSLRNLLGGLRDEPPTNLLIGARNALKTYREIRTLTS